MKRLKKYMAVIVVVIMLASPVLALDQVGNPAAIPGFETETQVDYTRSIVNINVLGTGLGLYPDEQGRPKYGYGVFGMQGSGFIVNNYVITAAHVVNPTSLIVRMPDGSQFEGPLVNVQSMQIIVSGQAAKIFYIDVATDYALLVFDTPCDWMQNLRIAATDTFHYFLTLFGWYAEDQIHVGDFVAVIVRVRDDKGNRTTLAEVRVGKVVAESPVVPPGYEQFIPWFGLDDFTMDVDVYPGDSGSPVIGFVDGVPCLIGIARAAGGGYSYAVRIDFIKLVTDATF